MKKGQIITNIRVEKVGFGGVGIGVMADGKKVLIKGSVLPQSIIDCIVIQSKRDHIMAMPHRVISIDPTWVDATPLCPHYSNPLVTVSDEQVHKNGCGGCKRQLLSYPKQLIIKTDLVHDSFRQASYLIDAVGLQTIIPSPVTYHYRNKIEFSFGKYITKTRNDRKSAELRAGLPVGKVQNWESTVIARNEAIQKDTSEFSHYHDWQLGFHKQGFYTHVVDIDQCYLISQSLHEVYAHIKTLCQSSWLPVHDNKTHEGFFRHLVLRQGINTGNVLLNLVVADQAVNALSTAEREEQRESLKKSFMMDALLRKHVTTFMITYNNGVSDAVSRKDTQQDLLRGEGYIFEELHFARKQQLEEQEQDTAFVIEDGQMKESSKKPLARQTSKSWMHEMIQKIRFRVSAFSFFQTNTLGAQELFAKAASMISLSGSRSTILDLYCGAGTIGLSFLAMGIGKFCIGIELVEDAIADAKVNSQLNKMDDQTYFAAGKAEVLISRDRQINDKMSDIWLIIVDPPREWLHKDVVEFLINLRQSHRCQLLYISCNPVTLARDLDLLVQWWWECSVLQPVDMFPHTHHVEMISVLS